ncbi:MAG: preprotein translocase subunit SecG [Bacteroidota bacterium]
MFILLGIVCVVLAVALTLVVIVQNSKGGGLSSTFGGGASQILGARRSSEFIEKLTWYLAIGVAIIAFAANIAASSATSVEAGSKLQEATENPYSIAPPAPVVDPNSQQ